MKSLEDRYLVAEFCEIACTGKTGRTGTDDSDLDAVCLLRVKAGLAAAAAGVAANAYLLFCGRRGVGGGFRTISTAALITLCCILGCGLLGTESSHAIIGTLMILTPGIAFTMGIRDFVQGDYLSGTIRMIDALLIAASIAIGTGLVLSLYAFLKGVAVV